ncbi:MAG: CcdB family protein [Caulobacter sp.]|nr:CcdB family protein [Caulobacter sp.]
MRQFDVFDNPSDFSRHYAPHLVVLQSHHLHLIDTVIVAPLVLDAARPLGLIDVSVELNGRRVIVAVSELANMARSLLKTPVANLAPWEDDLRRALDRLFTGF